MALAPGDRRGPFQIVALIGAGGMGEVYRARDTKLDRDVALKILPDALAGDPDRMARFEREAKVLASLNHPNIAAIYGLEERALIMELVEGPTLAERIALGAVPFEEALAIARQITSGLEAAHEKGIVHRDLKPANIKVTPEGVVKILDFGLAKAAEEEQAASVENSPTLTMRQTQLGMILGTAGYMAPEQARGKPVDKRADIWAFGVVLYEMLAGRRLFDGEDVTATLAAVVMKEPDWESVPAPVRRLLRNCLQKDPKKRLRDIGDVWTLLEEPAVLPAQAEVRATKSKTPWVVAAVLGIAALALGYVSYLHWTEETRVLRLFIPPPEKGTFAASSSIPAVSPDGRRVAFIAQTAGRTGLWVRDLDALAGRLLPGTEDAQFPFWSPDSRTVAFFANAKLKKIDVAGGPAVTLCDAAGIGGSWSKQDVILFAPGPTSGLFRVLAAGGTPTQVTTLNYATHEVSHRYPWFLPDGHHFLFTARNSERSKATIAIGDLESKSHRPLLTATSTGIYSPPGYLLFLRERTLMAQPFDAGSGKITGEAVPIAEQVDTPGQVFAESDFSASQNGVLIYRSGSAAGAVQLTWFDRSGIAQGTVGQSGAVQDWPAISPDGKTVASTRTDPSSGSVDIWTYNLANGNASRFTFGPAINQWPIWSPDGAQLVFNSTRDGHGAIYRRAASGAAQDELVDQTQQNMRADDWSRDGRYLIEGRLDLKTNNEDLWVLPLFGDKKPFRYLHSGVREEFARLSPSGRWLAYDSDESKRPEIYVQTFPKPGGKWQISNEGGTRPIWSRDGKELYFLALDGKMMAAAIKSGPNFDFDPPKPLFDSRIASVAAWYDVSKEGRFLIPVQTGQSSSVPLTVVVNWTAALQKK